MSAAPAPQWQVESCDFAEVKRWASPAAREHVKVDNPEGTRYFCVRNRLAIRFSNGHPIVQNVVDNRLGREAVLGFAAMFVRAGRARFKADYVLPDYRGKGIGRALIAARLAEMKKLGVSQATAFCTPLSLPLYLAAGFKEVSRNPRGIAFCKRP